MGWLARRRRRKSFHEPFPQEWATLLGRQVPLYRRLNAIDRAELHGHINVLLEEKYVEGCAGLEVTDGVRLVVFSQAALLLLHRQTDYFPLLSSVLVYPDLFTGSRWERDAAGVITEEIEDRSGESWGQGAVVLSWRDVEIGLEECDGYNVVLHEFAHQLDQENGEDDGMPLLQTPLAARRWEEVAGREFSQFARQVRRGRPTFLDPYAAEHPAEFFAVATEYFFEKPLLVKMNHPGLYRILQEYYRQDPAGWFKDDPPEGAEG